MFFLFCIVLYFLIELNYLTELLYNFQLSGYSVKSIFRQFYLCINYFSFLFLCFIILNYFSIITGVVWLQILLLCIMVIINFVFLFRKKYIYLSKIIYTKRMCRLIFLILVLLGLLGYFIFSHFSLVYVSLILPLFILINYVVILISNIILTPIEKVIGLGYICKATKKISKRSNLIKVGITGSFGKTSTKEILTVILGEFYNVVATPKSYNTPFGITKTILGKLDNTTEVFVCEMGAKKRGEISQLCKIVNPDIGIVTTVGRQHLQTFGSLDGVYCTKKELPDYLSQKFCVFNLQNNLVKKMYNEYLGEKIGVFILKSKRKSFCKALLKRKFVLNKSNCILSKFWYAFIKLNNVYAKLVKCDESSTTFGIYFSGEKVCEANTILLGEHNVINILLAVAVAIRLGVPMRLISSGIRKIAPVKARLEKTTLSNGAIVLNNGYNSNLDSVQSTIKILGLFDRKYRVIITPGLVETDNNYEYNKKFAKIISQYANKIVIVKSINRKAILDGLNECGYDMKNVVVVDSIQEAGEIINNANDNYVFLLENDLPDNYK